MRAGTITLLTVAALAACREQTRTPAAQAPPASSQGSVNPDPGLTRYACMDGQAITAGYPDRTTAVVTFKDHAYTLKLAPSAGGARYVGFGLQWWVKGAHAAIAPLKSGEETASGAGVDCTEIADRGATRI
jgi:membrane-bound inhibitor of C-type lysozyme